MEVKSIMTRLEQLKHDVSACRACPRLVAWREETARVRKAAYRDEVYWGRPVPGFGDPDATALVVGLAPGAHGANRTGRVFTGDRSGDWLYRALHKAGFASQPNSDARDDGMRLTGAYIACMVRCAPPGNKPQPDERDRCQAWFTTEIALLGKVRVVVCLGGFAWEGVCRWWRDQGGATEQKVAFAHGAEMILGPYHLLGCYHPSQQNTFTGRLTEPMIDAVFERARTLALT